ncbi:hypothetical protein N9L06_07330 [Mariniblastus sp.]|nr:hypothetical protein [Mariniblastus sp.]
MLTITNPNSQSIRPDWKESGRLLGGVWVAVAKLQTESKPITSDVIFQQS